MWEEQEKKYSTERMRNPWERHSNQGHREKGSAAVLVQVLHRSCWLNHMNMVLLTNHVYVMEKQGKWQISKPAVLCSAQRFDLTTWYRTILKQEEGAEQRKKFPVTLGKYILYTNISLECWALPTVEQKSKMASWRGIIAAQQWGAWQQGQSSSSRTLWTVQAGQQCRYSINWWSREWQMAALASAQGYQV